MSQKIENPRILLTAFQGTSAELLIKDTEKYFTLFLPNDKVKDSEILMDAISKKEFDFVLSFGQRPNIKDKVHIETTARDGEFQIDTSFDYDMLKCLFEQKGIVAKISHNAGTSFCNRLYLNGLKYIEQNDLNTKMIFVHVPFAKNITNLDEFRKRVYEVITGL